MKEILKTSNEFGEGEVHSWASILEDGCRKQAESISRVSILDGYLALMPDAHFGFGPPVGSALKTRDAVMPYAVGVDIGCGMIAVATELHRHELAGREREIMANIRTLIPSGMGGGHRQPLPQAEVFFAEHGTAQGGTLARKGKDSFRATAESQFGTLGSGNHFVEVSADEERRVWFVLHSGSRGAGNQLATSHVAIARASCTAKLESSEFAFVERGSEEYEAYLADMLWAQAYALAQREAMMDNLILAVERALGVEEGALTTGERINCHHNYVEELEPGLWLTRKGAIDASEGKLGIIPGSMGTDTYVVEGLGNADAYHTSPHGAGRLLGRNVAKKSLSVDDFKAQMAGRTWLDRDAKALLDEAPSAYKPIETVMADSADLIRKRTRLSAFINYKGL